MNCTNCGAGINRDESTKICLDHGSKLCDACPECPHCPQMLSATDLAVALEQALGNNLVWIGDLADQGVRQKDPETLRRLTELNRAWKLAVKYSR